MLDIWTYMSKISSCYSVIYESQSLMKKLKRSVVVHTHNPRTVGVRVTSSDRSWAVNNLAKTLCPK